ncbi:MAG: DNA repair protein RecO [Chloroflexi bacterium]|nr:DNA repair protein RecO [Chloroflexota bacterium]
MAVPRVYRTEAIVLRRQDFGEADRVLTLYSPRLGKFRAVAKGVRRPRSRLGGHVELFTHVNLLVAQGRNLDIVTQAETVRPYCRIRDDLWKTAYACYAAELVDRFIEERLENAPVFDLLQRALVYLDELGAGAGGGQLRESPTAYTGSVNGAFGEVIGASDAGEAGRADIEAKVADPGTEVELAMRSFELQLLGHLGYAPELFHCVQCNERLALGENQFTAAAGGVLCADCGRARAGARPVSVNAIKAMRLMGREPFGVFRKFHLAGESAREVDDALRSLIGYLLERQLRTAEFLDRLKADRRRERRLAEAAAG